MNSITSNSWMSLQLRLTYRRSPQKIKRISAIKTTKQTDRTEGTQHSPWKHHHPRLKYHPWPSLYHRRGSSRDRRSIDSKASILPARVVGAPERKAVGNCYQPHSHTRARLFTKRSIFKQRRTVSTRRFRAHELLE